MRLSTSKSGMNRQLTKGYVYIKKNKTSNILILNLNITNCVLSVDTSLVERLHSWNFYEMVVELLKL